MYVIIQNNVDSINAISDQIRFALNVNDRKKVE